MGNRAINQDKLSQELRATREAIRHNWKWLRGVYLHGHDLSDIKLYGADLAGADFGEATLTRANFCKTSLFQADLDRIQDWGAVDLRLANIKGVRRAPQGFRKFAMEHGALEEEPQAWFKKIQTQSHLNCLVPANLQ